MQAALLKAGWLVLSLMVGVMISLSVGFLICKMGVRRLSLPRKAGGSSKFGEEVSGPVRRYSRRPALSAPLPPPLLY